ncbi:replication-relaxation family protein [Streptacidiphilus carbonis]|uniref:replication-relaxation family protein n=1 Tax=Streptacidiphilus carbonis TaxID=105422 RepID=UPI0005A6B052|nr:replication-relaxation family protein [Streptacidiphilus carbonis]
MADQGEPEATAPVSARPSAKRPRANTAGSTAKVRAEVLTALGVLKVVTADQLWRLLRPEAKENKFARAALNDLQSAKLVHSEGRTSTGHKTWGLTTAGRDAAQQVMPAGREVGNIARGAGRSGAPHAMAVNETILAFLTGGTGEGAGPGMGTILSWTTEVVHEAPNKRRAQADAVLRAPEHQLPVLLVEVDRATEAPHILARKFERYAAYFAHQVKVADPDAYTKATKMVPAWQLAYGDPIRSGYPPIAVVFTGASDTVLRNRMKAMRDLSHPYWEGRDVYASYTDYQSAIPIVVTTLGRLQQHGPLGQVWWRLGHSGLETLGQALANPDGRAAYRARQEAEAEAERLAAEAEEREREHQEREASRCPVCHRAADEYEDWDDAAHGGNPCQPCVRAQQEAEEHAARQQLDQAIAQNTGFLQEWTENTTPRRVLARQALDWGKELLAAWNDRHSAAQRPAPLAPTPRPAPRGGTRSPAARTALQQLLAELEAEPTGQPTPGTEAEAPPQAQPPAPRRAVIQRPSRPAAAPSPDGRPAYTRAQLQARYAGLPEPLRSRMIALIEERQRQQRDQDQPPPQDSI